MNQIVPMQQTTAVAPVSDAEIIKTMEASLYPGARPESIALVLSYCRARNLDPMMKPAHIVPMWVKDASSGKGAMRDVIMPGIYSYRIDAARTGQYVGKSEPEYGPPRTETLGGKEVSFPEWCKITVHRLIAGKERPFTAKEFWLENYATAGKDTIAPNAMWTRRSYAQLAKVTEAQALRMAFPEAVSNQPTDDEMEGRVIEHQAIAPLTPPEPPSPPLPPPAEMSGEVIDAETGEVLNAPNPPAPSQPPEWSFKEYVAELDKALSFSATEDELKAAWKGRAQPVRKLSATETTDMVGLLDKHKTRIAASKPAEQEAPPEPPMPEPPTPDEEVQPATHSAALQVLDEAKIKAKEGLKKFNFWVGRLTEDQFEDLQPHLNALRLEAAKIPAGA